MPAWAPPEAEEKQSWQPPEAESWAPPEAVDHSAKPPTPPSDLVKSGLEQLRQTPEGAPGYSESLSRPDVQAALDYLRPPPAEPAGSVFGQLPRMPQQQGVLRQIAGGYSNAVTDVVEGLTSPQNLALLPAAAVRGVGRLAGLLFGAQALSDVPEAARETIAPDRTLQERIQSGSRTLTDILFGAAGTGYGVGADVLIPKIVERSRSAAAEISKEADLSATVPKPAEEVKPNAEQITQTAQPDGLRAEPAVPPKTEEPAIAQGSEGIPPGGQGPQVQEVTPPSELANERIASAAWKLPDGQIVETGGIHGDSPNVDAVAGFTTTEGRFLNRRQAYKLARTYLPEIKEATGADLLNPGKLEAKVYKNILEVQAANAPIEQAPMAEVRAPEAPPAEAAVPATEQTSPVAAEGQPVAVPEEAAQAAPPEAPPTESSAPTAVEHDWTGATSPAGKGMRLSQTAGQAGLTINPLASPIVAKALKTIEIRKMSPLDAATTERSARLQQSFADAERAQKEIRRAAPTERRQAAISVWMEANGDAQTLSQWAAAAKGKAFREAASAAQSLTPDELAIAQKARAAFDVLEKRGNTYDVLGNHRDNYVPHVWEVSKDFTGIGSSKLQDRFKFNKARTFNNFFEGDQAGFQPKTLAIGKLLPAYLHEMNKVIADRQFIQDLQAKGATASDGSPLVIPRGRVSTIETDSGGKAYLADPNAFKNAKDAAGNPIDQSKYKVIGDQPALNDWRWESKDAAGNPIFMKDDLAVHPELAKRLNATMGQSAIRQWYNEPSTGVAIIPKAIAKSLDTAQSVMKREMFSLLAPFHQVQEGTHAIGHTVNPFGGLEDMSRPTPEHIDAMQHGLMLLPDRSSSRGYIEGLGGRGGFIAQAGRWLGEKAGDNVIGKAANTIASTVDGYQNYLFHQYIPALKFKTYQHILERNSERYSAEIKSGKVTEADVKLLSSEQTNAAYGHLNYALLDRNPTMQHITQLALLAPDFLEARGRFVAQAAKSLVGEKAGHEQFRAIAVLAAAQAATMFTLSQVLGGEYDWKHPFEMTIGNRRYMLRSVPEDLHRLLFQGPDVRREFVSARVNPTLQKVDQLRTGLNYRGEKTTATETLGELIANYIPITARSIPGVRRLTETSRNNPVSPIEQLAGSLGLKISRYSAITHTHQLAAEWMDKQGIERDRGVYPTSKFTPLRYALEDADLPRAEKEWKKLVGDEGDEKKLAEGFKQSVTHPFTGNKSRDQDFANSLKGKDRLLYDRALEVREGILDKFNLIH